MALKVVVNNLNTNAAANDTTKRAYAKAVNLVEYLYKAHEKEVNLKVYTENAYTHLTNLAENNSATNRLNLAKKAATTVYPTAYVLYYH